MEDPISDERVMDILDKTQRDWWNIKKFFASTQYLLYQEVGVGGMPQEDRQKLVEAYNLYRAAPYNWHYSVE